MPRPEWKAFPDHLPNDRQNIIVRGIGFNGTIAGDYRADSVTVRTIFDDLEFFIPIWTLKDWRAV